MGALSDWSIRVRTGAAFSALLFLPLVLGLCSYLQMGRLQANVPDMGQNWLPSVQALSQMEYYLARARGALLGEVLQSKTPADLDVGVQRLEDYFSQYDQASRHYGADMSASPEERRLFDAVQPLVAAYHAEAGKVVGLMRQSNAAAAADTAIQARDKFAAMIEAQDKVIAYNNQAMDAVRATFASAKIIVGVAVAAALLVGVLAFQVVIRTVCAPVQSLRGRRQ